MEPIYRVYCFYFNQVLYWIVHASTGALLEREVCAFTLLAYARRSEAHTLTDSWSWLFAKVARRSWVQQDSRIAAVVRAIPVDCMQESEKGKGKIKNQKPIINK